MAKMNARYAGKCVKCNCFFPAGAPIIYTQATRECTHVNEAGCAAAREERRNKLTSRPNLTTLNVPNAPVVESHDPVYLIARQRQLMEANSSLLNDAPVAKNMVVIVMPGGRKAKPGLVGVVLALKTSTFTVPGTSSRTGRYAPMQTVTDRALLLLQTGEVVWVTRVYCQPWLNPDGDVVNDLSITYAANRTEYLAKLESDAAAA